MTAPQLNLEQLKKRAKELKTAFAAGDAVARARVIRNLPAASRDFTRASNGDFKLTQAQWVIAREAGFASWPRLLHALEIDALSGAEAEAALVRSATAGDLNRVNLLSKHFPQLGRESVWCALVLGAAEAGALIELAFAGRDVNEKGGPLDWPPLMYVCGREARDAEQALVQLNLATALLDIGADPNVGVSEQVSLRGFQTLLGAAVGKAKSPELAQLLLARGANIDDGPTLYEGCAMWSAVSNEDIACLTLLAKAEPPYWHLCHALPHSLRYNNLDLVRVCLEYKADPNWTMGAWGFGGSCLHEAVALDCSESILRLLLESGAIVDFGDRDGRTALQQAVCLGRDQLEQVLLEAGAESARVRPLDRWVAACLRGDQGQATPLRPGVGDILPVDHLWLCRAIRSRNTEGSLLLLTGCDPSATDDDGQSALHLAAAAGDVEVCERLIGAGADAAKLNFAGETPLDCALGLPVPAGALVELLGIEEVFASPGPADAEAIARFERAADAVVTGDVDQLRLLLADNPELATAHSPRPHRCTLLHYLGANGVEEERMKLPPNAVQLLQTLIDAGSDPDASCYTYRGGPDQTVLGLLLSSDLPRTAGLALPMTAALGRAGATLSRMQQHLVTLYFAANEGTLAQAAAAIDATHRDVLFLEASGLGEMALVAALLDAGADVNAATGVNSTALHQAAISNNRKLVDLLLARGADPRIRDTQFDGSAVGWAYAGGHAALGQYLQAKIVAMPPG